MILEGCTLIVTVTERVVVVGVVVGSAAKPRTGNRSATKEKMLNGEEVFKGSLR
jgi:hypothetical protein